MTRLPHRSASPQRRLRGRAATLLTALTLAAVALTGCSGDDDDPDADPSDTTSASADAAPVVPITDAQAGKIKAKMSPERVQEILGEPVLTQEPFSQFAGGCFYYAMENRPPADVWQFCFNDQGISVILTAFSPNQPAAPQDASPARATLIGRGDSICQSQDGHLATITTNVGDALVAFSDEASDENLDAIVDQIALFITNLEQTHEMLAAFTAPDDTNEALTTYLDALTGQIDALTQAQQAVADRNFDAYDEHGTEFNDIGKQARTAAQEYGFTTCSAPDWG